MSSSEREQELAAALADALTPGPEVPPGWLDAARAAWTWRTVDAELAELAFESVGHPAGARSGPATDELTTLVFHAQDLVVVVEARGPQLRVLLTPDAAAEVAATVVVEAADGSTTPASAAAHGSFTADGVPAGPVRLRVHHDGRTVLTSWFRAG